MAVKSKTRKKVYKFVHWQDEYLVTTIQGIEFKQKDGWLEILRDGTIIIRGSKGRGYAWDGCTPKYELFDFIVGTPDGVLDYFTEEPITYYASMVHDILYQFREEVPISRKTTDQLFRQILKEAGFRWWWLYYGMVRLFGGSFGKWKTKETVSNLRVVECSWIRKAYAKLKVSDTHFVDDHPLVNVVQQYDQPDNYLKA